MINANSETESLKKLRALLKNIYLEQLGCPDFEYRDELERLKMAVLLKIEEEEQKNAV